MTAPVANRMRAQRRYIELLSPAIQKTRGRRAAGFIPAGLVPAGINPAARLDGAVSKAGLDKRYFVGG